MLWLALLGAGAYAYAWGLDREGFPPINTPIALVRAPFFAADPEVVDTQIARPLGDAILATPGVSGVDSFAGADNVTLLVEFDSDFSSAEGVAAIRGLEDGLVPEGVPVEYSELDAAAFLNRYDLLVSIIAVEDVPVEQLEAQAGTVAQYLESDDDVAVADVQPQMTEAVDPRTGRSERRQTSFSRVFERGDPGFRQAVTLGVDRAGTGLDTLELSDHIGRLLREAPLTDGYEARITSDFATGIRIQLDSLQRNLLTGLVAVAFVSLLLIGWRTAAITAAFMVTVLAATLLALMLLGQSLNTITLFSLILVLGLIVDDAIVITESIDANRRAAEHPADVVRVAIDRVAGASFAGTLTTVLVFVPILFVSGILGEFLRAMPITVIIALLLSFFLSITVIAALGAGFLLRGAPSRSPVASAQRAGAERLGRLVGLVERRRRLGLLVGAASVLFSLAVVGSAIVVARGLTFNIFPPSKDANAILVEADFGVGGTLEDALVSADEIDRALIDVVGDDLLRATYFFSGPGGANVWLDLTGFADRGPTARELVTRIEERFVDHPSIRLSAGQIDNGPPAQDYPFAVQIIADDAALAARELADDLAVELDGLTITRSNGTEATIVDAIVSTDGQVARSDGQRIIEVRAQFDAEDLTALLDAAETAVAGLYPAAELEARGLSPEDLRYDYGQEAENQEGFASAGFALQAALLAMLALLVVQFRSIVQPVLIMLAIPFGLFGVFVALRLSDNPLSFFVLIGLIGLIGVVVNNTILLTDAANREWRAGATNAASIAAAVQLRFRPLVATTATTVVGLAPLAFSDPFWEPMAFTLMFGLVSSTVLVLVAFPFYYLALVPPARRLFAEMRRRTRTT